MKFIITQIPPAFDKKPHPEAVLRKAVYRDPYLNNQFQNTWEIEITSLQDILDIVDYCYKKPPTQLGPHGVIIKYSHMLGARHERVREIEIYDSYRE